MTIEYTSQLTKSIQMMKANLVSYLLKKRRNGVLGFIDCCIVLRCCKWSVRFIISVPLLHVSVVMTIGPLTESRPRSKQYTISQTAKAHCCCNIPNNPCTIPTTHRPQYAESESLFGQITIWFFLAKSWNVIRSVSSHF